MTLARIAIDTPKSDPEPAVALRPGRLAAAADDTTTIAANPPASTHVRTGTGLGPSSTVLRMTEEGHGMASPSERPSPKRLELPMTMLNLLKVSIMAAAVTEPQAAERGGSSSSMPINCA